MFKRHTNWLDAVVKSERETNPQLTIRRPRPISTATSDGSEGVSGTSTTSNTTKRCTELTRPLRHRAPFSPLIVRTTGISGKRIFPTNREIASLKFIAFF